MRTIAIANQKGGCGKTTTAINLSSCLASKGRKVLLIDLEPQSHETMGLNVECDPEKNIYHVIAPARTKPVGLDDVIVPVKENFDIAPSDTRLCAVEQELALVDGREKRLLDAIERLSRAYDFVIIDCPPSIGHLCFNALRAGSEAIIPIDMSLFSLRGVAKLTEMMVLIEKTSGHKIAPRALVTMFDARTRYSQEVLKRVREKFDDKVYDAVIRYNIRLRETVDHGVPIGDYDRRAIGQKDYEALSEEVLGAAASAGAKEISRTARDYIDTMEPVPASEDEPEAEECFPYPAQSAYSAMIKAIAGGAVPEWPDEGEEPDS